MPDLSFFKNIQLPSSFWPWKKGGESVLGVDFGSSTIKLVELKKRQERAVLMTYGELSLGPYGGVEVGRVSRVVESKAKEALEDLLRESRAQSREAIVGIPARS